MNPQDDILASLDLAVAAKKTNPSSVEVSEEVQTESYFFEEELQTQETEVITPEVPVAQTEISQDTKKPSKILSHLVFLVKYFSTSLAIFAILMGLSNYSAYSNIAYSFFFAEQMEDTKQWIIESVDAANIWDMQEEVTEVNTFKALEKTENPIDYSVDMHSVSRLAAKAEAGVDLGIEITPYDNRVVIPKIGKNIPLIEIQEQNIEGMSELNDIFMKELENGIIRYPGSAKPGNAGNSFIFGHSSNFPWLNGDYNDVFSLLDNVTYDDEVIVYYGQQKYVYKITKKEVISPGDVEVLKSKNQDLSEITLMTCWPIGTTYNRLVVVGELIHVQ